MEHALTKYRTDHGLTLEAFGALIGASKGMVHKWEKGALPRKNYMEAIVRQTDGAVTPSDWYSPVKVAS